MLSTRLAAALATTFALALASTARADEDVLRLKIPAKSAKSADTLTLGSSPALLDADLYDARWRGGYGGYRGGYGGYRGYYGGYRGYVGGYRGYYGGYRGYYGGLRGYYGYRPYYSSYYYPSYSFSYSPYYSSNYYYGGYPYYGGDSYGGYPYYSGYYSSFGYSSFGLGLSIADLDGADAYPICRRSVVIRSAPTVYYSPPTTYQQYPQNQQYPQYQQPPERLPAPYQNQPSQEKPSLHMPRADESNTYPYDGGPTAPVPMPQGEDKPTLVPPHRAAPAETFVSYPSKPTQVKKTEEKKTGKWNFPAYGEKPSRGAK